MPIPDIYGPLVSRRDVEQATLACLQAWIVAYVAAVERYQDLPARTIPIPPSVDSFVGDVDYDAWEASRSPTIVVNAQPYDAPERVGSGIYSQWFDVVVAAIVSVTGDADATRTLADQYGIAIAALLSQQGGLGTPGNPFAEKSRLMAYPRTEYIERNTRDAMRTIVGVRSWVCDLVDETAGPRTPPEDPYARYSPLGKVTSVHVTVNAEPLSDNTP